MKRKLKNIKGFAMAELLAVSMVILVLFSILFSNYLPLVAEYENRLSYNDVTASYAGYYVRKMYLTDNNNLSSNNINKFNTAISSNGFYTVYSSGVDKICTSLDDQKYCNNILNEYGVEEIIITNYSMSNVKKKYSSSSGKLYKYIKYLPDYSDTIYKGSNDLYRIILKTKDGYATTPIKADYYTPGSCFIGKKVSGGIKITKYKVTGSDCGTEVTIRDNKNLTMKDSSGNSITGKVISIGDSAFEDSNVTGINLNGMVKTIGKNAFKNSKLERILLDGVTTIGDNAFDGSMLYDITIPSSVTTIGTEVFANNVELYSVVVNNTKVTDGEFMNSGKGNVSSIKLNNVTSIGDNAFKNFKFNNTANYNNTISMPNVTTIGDNAFSYDKPFVLNNVNIDLSSVTSIGVRAFYNFDVKNIKFGSSINSISEGAFYIDSSSTNTISSLDLRSVNSLGVGAFENRKIDSLTLNLASIPRSAFKSCGISSVSLGNVSTIGESAFENNSFSSLELSDSLVSVDSNAFKGNTSINTLSIPSSLVNFGTGAFDGWNVLETVNNNSTKLSDSNLCNVFASDDSTCKVTKTETGYSVGYGERIFNVVSDGGNSNE